jgi:diadenosine tetraphosphatase ApaH/serine/threonine PP2A family protein phosphatase
MKVEIPENSMVIVVSGTLCIGEEFAHRLFSRELIISIKEKSKNQFSHIQKILSNNSPIVICCLSDQEIVEELLLCCKKNYIKPVLFLLKFSEECSENKHIDKASITDAFSGFKYHIKGKSKKTYVFNSKKEADLLTSVVRKKLKVNKRSEQGPFDIIGDVHGCFDELRELLTKMGYKIEKVEEDLVHYGYKVTPPISRKVIFLWDLVDRGPFIMDTLKLAMSMVNDGIAYCILGNHDEKFLRKLKGRNVTIMHGLEMTMEQLKNESKEFKERVKSFLNDLPFQLVLDEGRLIVVHAGVKENMQGKTGPEVKEFALYGESTGDKDEYGLPERINWAKDYTGKALVVYGHTVVENTVRLNNTLNLDTGCIFGGKLTALRYPELTLVEVHAKKEYIPLLKSFTKQDF